MKTERKLMIDENRDITDGISYYLKAIDMKYKITNGGREGLDSGLDIFSALLQEVLLEKRNIVVFTASNRGNKEIQEMFAEGAKAILKKR